MKQLIGESLSWPRWLTRVFPSTKAIRKNAKTIAVSQIQRSSQCQDIDVRAEDTIVFHSNRSDVTRRINDYFCLCRGYTPTDEPGLRWVMAHGTCGASNSCAAELVKSISVLPSSSAGDPVASFITTINKYV